MNVRSKDQASKANQPGEAGAESMAGQGWTENDIDPRSKVEWEGTEIN